MLGLLACATSGPPTATQPAPPEAAPIQTEPISEDADCLKTCLRNNMARAVAAEIIEADCRASCNKNKAPINEL